MRILHELFGSQFCQARFHFQWRLALCQPSAIRDTKNVRVHGDRGLAEGSVQYDIGRLSTDAGQCF